jgi:hypothetical protein
MCGRNEYDQDFRDDVCVLERAKLVTAEGFVSLTSQAMLIMAGRVDQERGLALVSQQTPTTYQLLPAT